MKRAPGFMEAPGENKRNAVLFVVVICNQRIREFIWEEFGRRTDLTDPDHSLPWTPFLRNEHRITEEEAMGGDMWPRSRPDNVDNDFEDNGEGSSGSALALLQDRQNMKIEDESKDHQIKVEDDLDMGMKMSAEVNSPSGGIKIKMEDESNDA
jgi:hypothetical protein